MSVISYTVLITVAKSDIFIHNKFEGGSNKQVNEFNKISITRVVVSNGSILLQRNIQLQFDRFKRLFCFSSQQVQFNTTFYSSPAVLVSVHNDYDRKVKNHIPPEYNIITAWIEVGHISVLNVYQRLFVLVIFSETSGKNCKYSILKSANLVNNV